MSDSGHRADGTLDITGEVCPMTSVKTRLALEDMAPGGVLEVLLPDGEPRRSVAHYVAEVGHEVLASEPAAGGTWRLVIRRG